MDSGVNGQGQPQVVVRKVIKVIKRPISTGTPVGVSPSQPAQVVQRPVQQSTQPQVVRKIIKVPVSKPSAPQMVQQPNAQRVVVQQVAPQQSVQRTAPVQQNVAHAPSSSAQSYSSRLNSLQQQAQMQAQSKLNDSFENDEDDDPNDEVIGYTTYYRGIRVAPFHYEIPDDIMDRIEARKKIPEKLLLLYIYARLLAQEFAKKQGIPFPKMYVDLPKDNFEALSLLEYVDDDLYTAVIKDFAEIAQFIPGLPRVMNSQTPIDQLIDEEVDRVSDQEFLSPSQQIVLSFLLVLADMRMVQEKLDVNEIKDDLLNDRDEIRQDIEEEEDIKRQFVKAIVSKHFPVDAKKLIDNYFNFSKKDPNKAYQLLITNPVYFSPIILEKMPKKFFGLKKAGPKDALAVNKKLASFLKNLKV